MKSEERAEFCRLLFEASKVPLKFVSMNGEVIFEYCSPELVEHPVYTDREIIRELTEVVKNKEDETPILRYVAGKMALGAVPGMQEDAGFFLIGPTSHIFLEGEPPLKMLNSGYEIYDNRAFSRAASHIFPQMSPAHFASFCNFVYYCEWGQSVPLEHILINSHMEHTVTRNMYDIQASLLCDDEERAQMLSPGKENPLMQYVLNGNSEALTRYLNEFAEEVDINEPYTSSWIASYLPASLVNADKLTASRMLFIASVSHTAELLTANGFSGEQAWMLWYSYVEKALSLSNVKALNQLGRDMLVEYTERRRFLGQEDSYQVRRCKGHIKDHYVENITPASIAKSLNCNARILSERFKKETGMSINRYIQRERVNAAKLLLAYTNESLVDISNIINFSSQSYFTCVFKKFTGYTPQEYRDKFCKRDYQR